MAGFSAAGFIIGGLAGYVQNTQPLQPQLPFGAALIMTAGVFRAVAAAPINFNNMQPGMIWTGVGIAAPNNEIDNLIARIRRQNFHNQRVAKLVINTLPDLSRVISPNN